MTDLALPRPRQSWTAPLTRASTWRALLPFLSLVAILVPIFLINPRTMSYFGLNLMLGLAIPIMFATLAQMCMLTVNDLDRYSELNAALHAEIRAIAGHRTSAAIIERLGAQVVRHKFRLARQPGRAAISLPQHELIVAAIVARDPEAAQTAMQQHLRSVTKALEAGPT